MTAMAPDEPSSIQTRPSLLNRLKSGEDVESWQNFYRIYGKLVRDFAVKAGLTDTEADEVVQETAIAIARHLPKYRYDPKVCRFKTWLLNQASWRIKDQLKKRKRSEALGSGASAPPKDDSTRTATIHRVPDPASTEFDALFEAQWRQSLFTLALAIGYFWAAGYIPARRGFLWIAGPLTKLLGASLFVLDHFLRGSPATFLLFAFTDACLGLLTLFLLLKR